jgi:hypothetical protein
MQIVGAAILMLFFWGMFDMASKEKHEDTKKMAVGFLCFVLFIILVVVAGSRQ